MVYKALLRRTRSNVDPKMAVIQALGASRQALLRIRAQIKRTKILAHRDEAARAFLQTLYMVENLLERVVLRLETMYAAGIVARDSLELPLKIVKWIEENAQGLPPDIGSIVSIVDEALSVAYAQSSELFSSNILTVQPGSSSAEVENIIKEAYSVASLKLKERGEQEVI